VSAARQWAWPIALNLLIVFGLLAALLGQTPSWWAASWLALSMPLVAIFRYWPLRQLFERKPRS